MGYNNSMESLGPKLSEIKDALWRTRIGQLVAILQARIERGYPPMDPLAKHEYEARKRGEPAHFDRVREQMARERQRDSNP